LTALFVFVGILLVRFNRLFPALAASLLSWVLLGFLGACIAEQSLSADHLRDAPAPIPWGTGYGIELSGVEFEGAFDRRAYLAQQNIDLVATLRAPELIERVRLRTPN
jgi:hypothetical protein